MRFQFRIGEPLVPNCVFKFESSSAGTITASAGASPMIGEPFVPTSPPWQHWNPVSVQPMLEAVPLHISEYGESDLKQRL